MEENKTETIYCSHCGAIIDENEDYETIDGEIVCSECISEYTVVCDHCGERIWSRNSIQDDSTTLCHSCYEDHYNTCENCGRIIHSDSSNWHGDYPYCDNCYSDFDEDIDEYNYKPEPRFYGNGNRFFGVELEIDCGGKDDNNARILKEIGNVNSEHIYIKSDGSLDDGLEIVSHPFTLEYHKNYCWEAIIKKAISLGYRSHQTSTCGLHVHVNRSCLGDDQEEQELVIGHILYFIEHHWNELLKFSRRSEYSMNRWAARYGYEKTGREILDKAKKGNNGRYAAVNLMNYSTIEFRLFRGTLKLNTLLATLELVNAVIETALNYTEDELHEMSWSDFVQTLKEPELVQYLKERRLYINEEIEIQEEM